MQDYIIEYYLVKCNINNLESLRWCTWAGRGEEECGCVGVRLCVSQSE